MNLFAKLNCVKYLSDTEHNIIDLINKDPVAFTQMTIREISSLAFVSKATIYRFCKKLGYSGLNELKLMVTASYADQLQHADKKVDLNIPFGKTDSAFTVISNLRDLYERSLFLATTFISVKDLQQIAVDLIHAVNIIVFVDDEQLHVAKIFKDRMESCGARVTVPANLYQKISLAQS
ncbi:MurR/RpiR family transcriptional regulator, partial [Enterococcus innesii]